MTINLEREQGCSYLVEHDDTIDFNSYPIQMLVNNAIKGVLNTSIRTINMKQKIYYNITSKQSLKQIALIKTLTANEIFILLKGIIEVVDELKEYLIGEEMCIFSPNYIFLEAGTLIPSICVLPKKQSENGLDDLIDILLEMLVEKDIEDKLAYCLFRFSKVKNKSIVTLKQLMEQGFEENINLNNSIGDEKSESIYSSMRSTREQDVAQIKVELTTKDFEESEEESRKCYRKGDTEIEDDSKSDFLDIYKKYFNKTHLFGVIILAFILIIILINTLCFKDEEGFIDIKTSVTVNIIVLVCMSGILYKVWKVTSNELEEEEENDIEFVPIFEFIDKTIPDPQKISEPCFTQFINVESTQVKQFIILDLETRIKHTLEDEPFVIGKLEEGVSLKLDNPVVSRLHAQLSKEDGEVYIQDLNSKNGTYVGDIRLEPGEVRKLEDREIISIANLRFEYSVVLM